MGDSGRQQPALSDQMTLSPEEQRVVRTLITALRRIQFGSVQIVVQDRRVVQIDTLEKQRINHKEPE